METLEAISQRASLKSRVSARAIEPEKIVAILNAARLAPSARNRQPWRFIVVEGKEAVATLVDRAFGEGNQMLREVPVIIVACANPLDDTVIGGRQYYLFDVALAVENMLLAATDLGLVTHIIGRLDEDELKRILGIPLEVEFVMATPLAYPAEGSYETAAQERLSKRTRKELSELACSNTWGSPLQL
ncbi:MAG: nitroreductase family protein [Chloroflexi bacterium]|nr:nitroreductase family protein [Chloroflexota bacterium]